MPEKMSFAEKRRQASISQFEKEIRRVNQRLVNIKKSMGQNNVYNDYVTRLEKLFGPAHKDLIDVSPSTGTVKIDYKKAAQYFAYSRQNKKSMAHAALKSVPTVKQLKQETAKQIGATNWKKVTSAQINASHETTSTFKEALYGFYNLIAGNDYREILLPEMYRNNHGDVSDADREIAQKLMGVYENIGSDVLSTASKYELEEIRVNALKEIGVISK